MHLRRSCALILLFASLALHAQQPFVQRDFPADEFKARWARLFDKIGPDAVAVVQGVPLTNGFLFPRQHNEFYYLCGIETPQSYLLLDGRTKKATLYLPPRNPRLEAAEGKVLSAEDVDLAREVSGVDDVQSTEKMRVDWLGSGRNTPRVIYTPFGPQEGNSQSRGEMLASDAGIANDPWDGRLPRQLHFAGLLRARYPRSELRDLTPVLDEMRSLKSPREIALIRRASQLAGLGILEAMRSTRPGVREYQLDAVARYIFLVNGARLEGYRSITAAGTQNIWNMHYYRNLDELKSGDLILLDYAPEYRYYVSDVTRMWPVNGTFAPWQRELLGFVLEYRNAVISRIRPGVTAQQVQQEAKAAMDAVFARWKFSKPGYEQAARRLVDTGGGVFSHPVGLTVHDDGPYSRGPLQPGHVFSIDPQLRVPEENLYIRYEDVVVVTGNGVENFTAFLPSELADIEKTVGRNGLLQKAPPTPEKAGQ